MASPQVETERARDRRATYSAGEVAEILGASVSSVRRWIDQGEIPSVRIGRRVFVPRWFLEHLLTPEGSIPESDPDVG